MTLSSRLEAVVEALPLRAGVRVIEVGGAPGAAAREVARRVAPDGFVLVVDRSERGLDLTRRKAAAEIGAGLLGVRLASAEEVRLEPGEAAYDVAFACRVGVLDGRHPEGYAAALASLRAMLVPGGRILVGTDDNHDPLREIG